MKKLLMSLLLVTVWLAGCQRSDRTGATTAAESHPADFNRVMEYLKAQELTELEGVEPWRCAVSLGEPNEQTPGLKLTTEHYEIFTTLLEPLVLRQVPSFLETAWRGYNGQLPQPIHPTNRSTVYMFSDRSQWETFTRSFAGEPAYVGELLCKIKAGAYYHNGACVTYNIGRTRTFSALGHEGWHQFTGRHFKYRLPSWLDEGAAMLFEEHRVDGATFRFAPAENDYRLETLNRTLAQGAMLSLKDLLVINPGEVLASDETEAVRSVYSQWYALVRFLREGGGGSRLNSYRRLLADAAGGNWPIDRISREIAMDRNKPRTVLWNSIVGIELFQKYIGADLYRIEREYLAFCRQIVRDR